MIHPALIALVSLIGGIAVGVALAVVFLFKTFLTKDSWKNACDERHKDCHHTSSVVQEIVNRERLAQRELGEIAGAVKAIKESLDTLHRRLDEVFKRGDVRDAGRATR